MSLKKVKIMIKWSYLMKLSNLRMEYLFSIILTSNTSKTIKIWLKDLTKTRVKWHLPDIKIKASPSYATSYLEEMWSQDSVKKLKGSTWFIANIKICTSITWILRDSGSHWNFMNKFRKLINRSNNCKIK